MSEAARGSIEKYNRELEREYQLRFPRSRAHFERIGRYLLDGTSHAIRWNEPFMPVARSAEGSALEDLDGHRILDYWQGHFANVLGHNPPLIRRAMAEALESGRGLQTGMVHEAEGEVAELVCRCTGTEAVRLTTSGSLGVFYAVLLARAFTGRAGVLKVAGGWHGSQPFGLKGVSAWGTSFDHLESEGLSAGAGAEIVLTRFNDVEELRRLFDQQGDRLACFVVEPVLGAGGGLPASREYLHEARRLTEKHGALLLCDEIITAFRFRAGDLSAAYGVRPDLLIMGKIMGGGMPVAAVAGRRDLLELCTQKSGRVKFEGGTYSAHELSLVAARTMLGHLCEEESRIYPRLAALGQRMHEGLLRVTREAGVPVFIPGPPPDLPAGSSMVMMHLAREAGPVPTSPEDLAERAHPVLDERLLKSTLLLEDLSVRSGLGAISAAHTEEELDRTLEGIRAGFDRLRRAGLL
jgi:glutamate-1-semialdehyde 2,1-aminomutase